MSRLKSAGRSQEIHGVIARLFAQRGYHSTSVREIARELGLNPSSLYHYFRSKEEILFTLMNDAMDAALATLDRICAAPLSPEEKLKRVLGFYTQYYAGNQERLTLLVNEMDSLSEDHRRVLIQKQRKYVALIRSILEELSAAERLKSIHPNVVIFAFFGMVHYTIKWYQPQGPVGLEELADSFWEILTRGILVPGTGNARNPAMQKQGGGRQ
jgi:AcrR family transcriptional regulator